MSEIQTVIWWEIAGEGTDCGPVAQVYVNNVLKLTDGNRFASTAKKHGPHVLTDNAPRIDDFSVTVP
jgi:hypothetical protein